MVEEKGLAPESADKISGFVQGNAGGAKELWAKLTEENKFGDHPVRQILGRLEESHVQCWQYSDRAAIALARTTQVRQERPRRAQGASFCFVDILAAF